MPQIKHAVLIKFKPSVTAAKIQQNFAALAALREKIPGLLDFSGGPYSSPEGINQGFTHGFIMTFADAASRNLYLTHPDHETFKQFVLPDLDGGINGVIAFDWEHS